VPIENNKCKFGLARPGQWPSIIHANAFNQKRLMLFGDITNTTITKFTQKNSR
jgi:hypothetical protein